MLAESSPFPHHGPLAPSEVSGRDDLVADLEARLTAHKVTALLGPRRFGKTSVLRRVAADLEEASTSVLWIDLFEVTSMVDLAVRVDSALAANRSRFGQIAQRAAAGLRVTLGAVSLSFSKPARPDPSAALHVLLDVVVRSATQTPTLIVLDEFSSIARVAGAAGLLRTKLQHHFSEVGLVFAGSQPSTMQMLFAQQEQPFYGQADLVTIGPLSQVAVHDIVVDGFEATGRDPGPLPSLVFGLCKGHPRRTMQVADTAWHLAEAGARYEDELWASTVAELEAATEDANEVLFASLPDSEQKVLRILASEARLYGKAAELLNLNPVPARNALASLIDHGHVHAKGNTLVDPLLEAWLRRRLPI